MYEVVVETFVDDARQDDMVLATKYVREGNAQNKAKEWQCRGMTAQGKSYMTRAYIRGTLIPVSEEEAKLAYCKDKSVYVDSEFGKDKIRPSYHYSSHASREELFYRSSSAYNYGNHYEGNYYIDSEEK